MPIETLEILFFFLLPVLRQSGNLRESRHLPIAKDKADGFTFICILFRSEQSWKRFPVLQMAYHNLIFIWHNGPICCLLTYTSLSVHSSNHWKLSGGCVYSFHYWGEEKDLGHLNCFLLAI